MNPLYSQVLPVFAKMHGIELLTAIVLFITLIVWIIVWKGMALWTSARKGHKAWFVAMLIVNTLGILEILYIYYFSKRYGKKDTA